MNQSKTEAARAAAIKRVNETLRGPVADIMSRLLPELQGLSRAEVYEKTLDDLSLLEKSFDKFRSERHWFRHVVVDHRSRPVLDDTVVLTCGRTLEETIAMVVRSAAKRYFRRVVKSVEEPVDSDAPPELSAADALYEAIKDYLMHEWQVPLVSTYANMSPSLVRSLGPKLLAMREIAELRDLIDGASGRAVPSSADGAIKPKEAEVVKDARVFEDDPFALLISLDGRRLRPDSFAPILERADVRQALSSNAYVDPVQSVTGLLWDVGGPVVRILINGLNISPEQLVVMLAAANETMGHQVFARLFGTPGQPELVLRLVSQGIADGVGPSTPLTACGQFIRTFVERAVRAGKAAEGKAVEGKGDEGNEKGKNAGASGVKKQ